MVLCSLVLHFSSCFPCFPSSSQGISCSVVYRCMMPEMRCPPPSSYTKITKNSKTVVFNVACEWNPRDDGGHGRGRVHDHGCPRRLYSPGWCAR